MPKPKPIQRRRRFSLQDRHALVVRFRTREKGQTAKQFADRMGVKVANLYLWDKDPRFAERAPTPTATPKIAGAITVKRGRPKGSKNNTAKAAAQPQADADPSEVEILRFLVGMAFSQGFLGMNKIPMPFLRGAR